LPTQCVNIDCTLATTNSVTKFLLTFRRFLLVGQPPGSQYFHGLLLTKSRFLCVLDYTELPFPLKALLCAANRSPKQLMASSPIDVWDDLYR